MITNGPLKLFAVAVLMTACASRPHKKVDTMPTGDYAVPDTGAPPEPEPAPVDPVAAPASAPPPARAAVSGSNLVLPVAGFIIAVPDGWRVTSKNDQNELVDEIERHTLGQAEVNVELLRVADCSSFLQRAVSNRAEAGPAPGWLAPGWPLAGYLTRPETAYLCSKFWAGSIAATIDIREAPFDVTTTAELRWLLDMIARGANRPGTEQYVDNTPIPLTVSGLLVTLPVAPHWYSRVLNDDGQSSDLLIRVKTAGLTRLMVSLELAHAAKCAAALADYPGAATRKLPSYLPAMWSPRALESVNPKAKEWNAVTCLESGPLALLAFVGAEGPPNAADAQALSALLTAVASAKRERDGTAPLAKHGATTNVLARQSGLRVAIPSGPVDWEIMNFRSESSDVFNRARPSSPFVSLWLSRSTTPCTLTVGVAGVRRVARPAYAPVDWGAADESTGTDGEIDANLCRGQLNARVRMPADSPPRDLADMRDLLAAIGAADKP